jgi:hypothetical protein
MDEEFSSALLTGCVLLASCGLYPARPAERFARRMPISLLQEASLAAHRLPPTNDPRVHPAYPGRPRGRAGHCPTTSRRRRPGPNRRLGWPSKRLPQLREEAPTQADHEPGMDAAATTPTPAIPPYGCLPTPRSRTSLRPDTADAATHKYRTPTPDAGQRTPGAQTPAPDTGHRSRGQANVDTGHSHRTPDTGHWPRTRTE